MAVNISWPAGTEAGADIAGEQQPDERLLSLVLTKQASLPGQASPALCTSNLQSTSCAGTSCATPSGSPAHLQVGAQHVQLVPLLLGCGERRLGRRQALRLLRLALLLRGGQSGRQAVAPFWTGGQPSMVVLLSDCCSAQTTTSGFMPIPCQQGAHHPTCCCAAAFSSRSCQIFSSRACNHSKA